MSKQSRELSFPSGKTHYIQQRIRLGQSTPQGETDSERMASLEGGIALRQELLEIISEVAAGQH